MLSKLKSPYVSLIGILGLLLLLMLFVLFTNSSKPVKMYYYFLNACGSCNETSEFKDKLHQILKDEIQNRKYELFTYNTFRSDKEYIEHCKKLGIEPLWNWPVMIIGDQVLYGDKAIEENVLQVFTSYRDWFGIVLPVGCGVVFLVLVAVIAYSRYLVINKNIKNATHP